MPHNDGVFVGRGNITSGERGIKDKREKRVIPRPPQSNNLKRSGYYIRTEGRIGGGHWEKQGHSETSGKAVRTYIIIAVLGAWQNSLRTCGI